MSQNALFRHYVPYEPSSSATEKYRINRCFSHLCGEIRNLTLTRFCDLRDPRAEQMSQNALFRHYVPYEPSSSATEKHRINRCFSHLCEGIRNLTLTRFCDLRDSRQNRCLKTRYSVTTFLTNPPPPPEKSRLTKRDSPFNMYKKLSPLRGEQCQKPLFRIIRNKDESSAYIIVRVIVYFFIRGCVDIIFYTIIRFAVNSIFGVLVVCKCDYWNIGVL